MVRACKTAADERAVIAKECAQIRSALRDDDSVTRSRNLAKLLYISMLGYPTHFGQMECVKILASGRFPEKRVGYLALSILLDENQEVLMLVTNTIKRDLNQENPYVIGLSLCALGNVASPEICRDLASDVAKLLQHQNPYIVKKAALCAVHSIRKAPELLDDFTESIPQLLRDRNHGVLNTGLSLAIEMLKVDSKAVLDSFSQVMPDMLRLLKNLVISGYAPEYDVSGITDPFLQANIIRFLRLVSIGAKEINDELNDVLAQVATNTESSKNPGNAILYECVLTIMSIKAEPGLRVMAVNILGRFLLNRDNNIRYVALSTLCICAKDDAKAIQRHRNTIVDCLKDEDISIRSRALDLIYSLVNKSNVKALVKELVNYLVLAGGDTAFKSDLTDKVTTVVERFSPDAKWHIDTIVQVLQVAGNITKDTVVSKVIAIISNNEDLHAYCVFKLFECVSQEMSQRSLMVVGIWTIGEYGGYLCSGKGLEEANQTAQKQQFSRVEEDDVLDTLKSVLKSVSVDNNIKGLALLALAKLSARFQNSQGRIAELLKLYSTDFSIELQSRSCEFTNLVQELSEDLRSKALGPIPSIDLELLNKKDEFEEFESDEEEEEEDETEESGRDSSPERLQHAPAGDLLDLNDLFIGGVGHNSQSAAPAPQAKADDLLDSLFSNLSSDSRNLIVQETPSEPVLFKNADIKVALGFDKIDASSIAVTMKTSNLGNFAISDFQVLVAVPGV